MSCCASLSELRVFGVFSCAPAPERGQWPTSLMAVIFVALFQVGSERLLDRLRIFVERNRAALPLSVNLGGCPDARREGLVYALRRERIKCHGRITDGQPVFSSYAIKPRAISREDERASLDGI